MLMKKDSKHSRNGLLFLGNSVNPTTRFQSNFSQSGSTDFNENNFGLKLVVGLDSAYKISKSIEKET